jgi:hypothetical protein
MDAKRGELHRRISSMFGDSAEDLERAKGIEPSYAAWEAAVLPLNYARKALKLLCNAVGQSCLFSDYSPLATLPADELFLFLPADIDAVPLVAVEGKPAIGSVSHCAQVTFTQLLVRSYVGTPHLNSPDKHRIQDVPSNSF